MRGGLGYMSNIIPKITLPSPEEDAAITAVVNDDPSNFDLDEEWSSRVPPYILDNRRPTRGKRRVPQKRDIHIRLGHDGATEDPSTQ